MKKTPCSTRNARLHELDPGTVYTDIVCGGPWTRGQDDPPHLPEEAEVFPIEHVAPSRQPQGAPGSWRAR